MRALLAMPVVFVMLVLQSARLALGQIWANKTRSTLTTIGIVIGVASVTAVIAAMTGLKGHVMAQFETFGINSIYVLPHKPDRGPSKHASWHKIRFYPKDFNGLLENCPSLLEYSFFSWDYQPVHFGEYSEARVLIRGVNPSWHKITKRQILQGRKFSTIHENQKQQVCIITKELRNELHLNRDCVNQVITIAQRPFRIIGMVEEKSEVEGGGGTKAEVLIPFNTVWKIWRPWLGVIANSKTSELVEESQAEIRFFLRHKRKIKPGDPDTFKLESVEKYLEKVEQTSAILTAIAGGIVSISLLVGGIGIMNIMLVSVSERTREIGLRKAVGATPTAILTQFLVEAVMLCMLGGLIGLALGQVLTTIISKLPKAELIEKAHIPLWAVVLAFGFSAFVGIFFGMFPAIKAARLNPIEALRHE